MGTDDSHESRPERRAETRAIDGRYYSVQFTTEGLNTFYQFKLWNISPNGICILVKESSEVLNHLKIGDTIEMTYYLTDSPGSSENIKTEIRHISKEMSCEDKIIASCRWVQFAITFNLILQACFPTCAKI